MLRAYPFTMARIEGSDRWAMVFDNTWEGMSRTEGVPLFNEQGEASELLNDVHKFVQELETDLERTRQFCAAPARDEAAQADALRRHAGQRRDSCRSTAS